MHLTRRSPRSFKFTAITLLALFITSFTNGKLVRVLAPNALAQAMMRNATFLPADLPSSGDQNIDLIIYSAGARHGVDPRLIHAVAWKESRYNAGAKSYAGAQGLMQMMPETARRFNCKNAWDAAQNVEAGTKYLRWLLERFDGDVTLALAGYNAGEGSVDKYAGVPPYGETQDYVRTILARYGKSFHPLLPPEQAAVEFNLLPQQLAAREQQLSDRW